MGEDGGEAGLQGLLALGPKLLGFTEHGERGAALGASGSSNDGVSAGSLIAASRPERD